MSGLDTGLSQTLGRLAQLQREAIDRIELNEAVESAGGGDSRTQLNRVIQHLQLSPVRWLDAPDPANMPALVCAPDGGWGVLRGQNAHGGWVSEWWDQQTQQWREEAHESLSEYRVAILSLAKPFAVSSSAVYQLIRGEIFLHKRLLLEAVLAGLMINTAVLATALYTLQVYDRVVPTGASQTLLVLTLGMLVAVLYEFVTKKVRSRLYDRLIDQVDQRLARSIYMRFLAVRLDQLPPSVGGLAAQMRGYETVRSFLTGVTTHLLVDAPFALLFVLIIAMIAGWLALIPLVFFILSVSIGWYYRGHVKNLADKANAASNFKTGLLVETVEGAETIKSGQGGWRMLSRWMKTTDEARDYELRMRNISEYSQYLVAAFQQLSYILIVACGALLVSKGELTLGSLIACSILSGRILAPVAAIPNQLVQWAHTKVSVQALDRLWALQDDHHGQDQPTVMENIKGHYRFENVVAQYGDSTALSMPDLTVRAGEKIAILGTVGVGKTTLLRILSGMYKPQSGRILLDDVDLAHISKPALAEQMGYVQQEGRLFAGTLRENLILGLLDPGDEAILEVARQTGLLQAVVATHPSGLQREIYEGGSGLSGGQRQLVNLTRAFLRKPKIWLLDEPTASMDRGSEKQVMMALSQAIESDHTLVLVTHKPEMLALVDRIIVIANHRVVMDGPKASVLEKLQVPRNVQTQEQHA